FPRCASRTRTTPGPGRRGRRRYATTESASVLLRKVERESNLGRHPGDPTNEACNRLHSKPRRVNFFHSIGFRHSSHNSLTWPWGPCNRFHAGFEQKRDSPLWISRGNAMATIRDVAREAGVS